MDPVEGRLYLSRRLGEVRQIAVEAREVEEEIVLALSVATPNLPMNALRWAEWVENRRKRLEHIDVELFVLAFEAPPPVWLVWREPVAPPWWRGLWPW